MKSFSTVVPLTTLALAASLANASPLYQLGGGSKVIAGRQEQTNQTSTDTPAPVVTSSDPAIINIPSPVNHTGNVSACQGYQLTSASVITGGVDGVLSLIGNCSAYGPDYSTLNLSVRFETDDRLRVQIADAEGLAHTVPTNVDYAIGAWQPISADGSGGSTNETSNLAFEWKENPFSFAIKSKKSGEVLFDTEGAALIFEEQYLRLRTKLPEGSNIQGLGQHNDNFTLPITQENYTRTIWSRDAYGLPSFTNLYGAHPVYINQITGSNSTSASSHGVFLLNSNGMDVKFPESGKYLEYNVLGGIFDLYFFAGPTPAEASRQYVETIGYPAEVPYWSLGFHQCRYGTNDIFEAAETVANYSAAGIPLETQWLDIDYMYRRWIMTLDPDRFELAKVRYFIETLKARGQHMIMMVDPAVATGLPQDNVTEYSTLQNGLRDDVFYKNPRTNETYKGVVWAGSSAFPDYTKESARTWWVDEMVKFFSPETGVDISGVWIDMNEPANFLPYLEANTVRISEEREVPPTRNLPRVLDATIEGFEAFQAGTNVSAPFSNGNTTASKRNLAPTYHHNWIRQEQDANASLADTEDPSLDSQWLYPPYRIQDRRAAPSAQNSDGTGLKNISDFSARTDIIQDNGARTYDEHNLYGAMHGLTTRQAELARKPGQKPFIIARSSFSGTGRHNGNWLGDSTSTWEQYIQVIRQNLQFAAFGAPVVGADTGGFGGNCTETLLARWAWLGVFNTFYRNHNEISSIGQEFYRYPLSTTAGQAAVKTRLRLLDYIYTFIHKATVDGTPAMWPLSWVHTEDANTISIEHQFYFGPSLMVSPVVNENSTSVTFYVPNATYYDFFDLTPVQGSGSEITVDDVGYETIPLHILGGSIIPLRTGDANTTAQNRELPFDIVVAPNATGQAYGELRLDDGISLDVGDNFSNVTMTFDNNTLNIGGTFGYDGASTVQMVVFAGQTENKTVNLDGQVAADQLYDAEKQTLSAWNLNLKLGEHTVTLA